MIHSEIAANVAFYQGDLRFYFILKKILSWKSNSASR